jgi:hypothetical protein
MNTAEVREALRGRWPASEYLTIDEAPQDAMRQGRKIDVLVVSLWKSRGYELDGVEIKVSVSDWRRELKNAEKADWWWHHVHRFWVAVPVAISETVRSELPTSWGLLVVTDSGVKTAVKAEKHAAEPIPWHSVIGIMRAASGAGFGALQRAEARGREIGAKQAEDRFERTTGDAVLREKHQALTEKVRLFEEASGIQLARTYDAERLGRLAKIATEFGNNPLAAAEKLERLAENTEREATRLREIASELLTAPDEEAAA